MQLTGKAALVTGGGSGIGRTIALSLASAGAAIGVNDLRPTAAQGTVEQIRSLGHTAAAFSGDVSDPRDVDSIVESHLAAFGHLNILVNCAGNPQVLVPTVHQKIEDWDSVIAVHLRGTYLCCRRVGREMIAAGGGAIVNIASVAAFGGFPMRTSYGPAKAAVVNLSLALAVEWGKCGVRVNAIAPGYVRTPLVEEQERHGHLDLEPIRRRVPLGRLGATEDVAQAALYLCSDAASYVTGVVLPVDGGWTANTFV